jgi:4-hydroxymandelate oxidase
MLGNDYQKPINLFEYETLAKKKLPRMFFDYYRSGAWDEVTLRDNRTSFDQFRLRPRMLVDVSCRDSSTKILGQLLQVPILIAPMAFQCLANIEGEVATAKAARKAGVGMILSTMSTKSIEEVTATCYPHSSNHPLWFQLYVHRDRELTRMLVERAYAAGYQALCLTVDAPILGRRERDKRNIFTLPPGLTLANLMSQGLELPNEDGESGLFSYFEQQLDPALTWKDLDWLKSLSPLPLVIKGILRGDDAARAVDHGVNAVIVSNHGGRQLDGAIASLDALPEVVKAIGGRAEVILDGGIRRGVDMLKALALGANAVLLGRPILWGLAVGGELGVSHVLELIQDEFNVAMALSGSSRVQDIDSSLITQKKT